MFGKLTKPAEPANFRRNQAIIHGDHSNCFDDCSQKMPFQDVIDNYGNSQTVSEVTADATVNLRRDLQFGHCGHQSAAARHALHIERSRDQQRQFRQRKPGVPDSEPARRKHRVFGTGGNLDLVEIGIDSTTSAVVCFASDTEQQPPRGAFRRAICWCHVNTAFWWHRGSHDASAETKKC